MARAKKPLVTAGNPAPETPFGQAFYQQFYPLDGDLTREELKRQIKVPLYAKVLLDESKALEFTNKEELKTAVRNFIIQGQHVVEDSTKLAGNIQNIGNLFINNIINRLPRHLTYLDDGRDLVLNALNCRYHGPAYVNHFKHLFYYLENLHTTIDEDYERSRTIQGGIDDNNREKSEAQKQADELAKKQAYEQNKKDFEKTIPEDSAGGIGL